MKEQKAPTINVEMIKTEDQENTRPDAIKSASVTICGREIPLYFDMRAELQIEDEMGMTGIELRENLSQLRKNPNSRNVIAAIRILGNRGYAHAGETGDLTDEWIIDHMSHGFDRVYKTALMLAITAGLFMETDNSWNEKQDEVLNEINKKKESTD